MAISPINTDDIELSLDAVRALHRAPEDEVVQKLIADAAITDDTRAKIQKRAVSLIDDIRSEGKPGLMEAFLSEYGLSTNEGIALMCLAEALLRVPDPGTINRLIEDKIAPHDWDEHFGNSDSSLVNASTAALMLTGRVMDENNSSSVMGLLHRTVKRLGEPVVRMAVKRAMQEMGDQFVLGQTIDEAIERGEKEVARGYLYSYDMLGEAALTSVDATRYFGAYHHTITVLGKTQKKRSITDSSGISVKLSALHPRFESTKEERLMSELVPRLTQLALAARDYNIGLNIDAEEADRLEITLKVIEATLRDERLEGWDGFGLVIQAYGKRASAVIDWLYELATLLDRKVMVRLVKGAYWDTEIKQAQVDGVPDFPVFTRRAATDISYICCAKKLLGMTDRIYPQFATHNAHTAAAILEMGADKDDYEFQRLHGMGERLHNLLLEREDVRCRIYAPVGPHKDLLAYLVRRLLENGANSSFVNQIADKRLASESIAADPFERFAANDQVLLQGLRNPTKLYNGRKNSRGWDTHNAADVLDIKSAREPFTHHTWSAAPIMAKKAKGIEKIELINPSDPNDIVGHVVHANEADVATAFEHARPWNDITPHERAEILRNAADLYEARYGEIFAVLAREAGKTPPDAIAELREAVDFLRYYANQADQLTTEEPHGIITCISPWNFPLAIFTGQIAAALAAGNGVVAKPAETTPIVASIGVQLLHEAGVPNDVLQFLPGWGKDVGAALSANARVDGACFTGSTATAQRINRALAEHAAPWAPLIAETGGLNAAIIDSTALPEQAVRHAVESAFQSAGQRCSAMRLLFVQEDIADGILHMLAGAMDELRMGDPWRFQTDLGPVITAQAQKDIQDYINKARDEDRLIKQLRAPQNGHFVGPAIIEVHSMHDMEREIFGPVLHVARFAADDYDAILESVNASGYGLTFSLHTRIDERMEMLANQLRVGNIYISRNQIGAIVGSQPFGGEGLSGTGPKAGGPRYLKRFLKAHRVNSDEAVEGNVLDLETVQAAIDALPKRPMEKLSSERLPGPTGEHNELSIYPRDVALCLGPTLEDARMQAGAARMVGCVPMLIAPGATDEMALDGRIDPALLSDIENIDVVAYWGDEATLRTMRQALAARDGRIIPLVAHGGLEDYCIVERHVCIDTTAAGGNATLLSGKDDSTDEATTSA